MWSSNRYGKIPQMTLILRCVWYIVHVLWRLSLPDGLQSMVMDADGSIQSVVGIRTCQPCANHSQGGKHSSCLVCHVQLLDSHQAKEELSGNSEKDNTFNQKQLGWRALKTKETISISHQKVYASGLLILLFAIVIVLLCFLL